MTKKDPKKAFKEIWRHHPELQNWSSSSWWFFLFLPKQNGQYGPKQMMFTFASRSGNIIKVNQTWQKGIDLNRKRGKKESFMTTVVGWINDGEKVHEEIVHQPALAHLDYDDQSLKAWKSDEDGQDYGAEIYASNPEIFEITGHFKGKSGSAKFKIWSDNDQEINLPEIIDIRGPVDGTLGNTNFVAWRHFTFSGDFESPSTKEHLEGNGYFQRVLMNIPMLPWSWCYLLFEDGSLFSSFMINVGLHNFRRTYYFFPQLIERLKLHFVAGAYFYNNKTKQITYFKEAQIVPKVNGQNLPDFYIEAKNDDEEFILMKLKTHNHAQFLLDRRLFKLFWQTKYVYNEFMFKVDKIEGKLNDENLKEIGQGWGNMEYNWGMSL